MLDKKAIEGILKATPAKRYRNFLSTVTDLEEVWFLSSADGFATFDENGFIYVLTWPREEFCKMFVTGNEVPISIEIHEFLDKCENLEENVHFMVFPTDTDSYVVTTKQLCSDIIECLDEIE